MLPHKYAKLLNRKQSVINTEVVRLRPTGTEIPMVATTEADQITVFWWNSASSRWDSATRPHQLYFRLGQLMSDVTKWNHSNRVGLAASNVEAFLVYKRKLLSDGPIGLFLDRLPWDA